MIKWLDQKESERARIKMNRMGSDRLPFAFLIDFLSQMPVVLPLDQCAENELFFITPHHKVCPERITPLSDSFIFHPKAINPVGYKKGFQTVMKHLTDGNSYLTNYTVSTRIITNQSPTNLFGHLNSKYQVRYKDIFLCFSPETFVTISDNLIRSFPMKGTIDAELPDAEKLLRSDLKEIAEHNTITDLIRNDLNIVARNVAVSRPKYIEQVEARGRKLLQMSSEITGILPKGWQAQVGDLFYQMLPAGSVTGAPKEKTVEIILQAETHQRGYYTGVFGVFDGSSIDSCVLIRFLEQTRKGFYYYKSGGGITVRSLLEKEFKESNEKIYVPLV